MGADATGLTAVAAFLLVPRALADLLVAGVETTGSSAEEPLPIPPIPVEAGGDLIPDPPSPGDLFSAAARSLFVIHTLAFSGFFFRLGTT